MALIILASVGGPGYVAGQQAGLQGIVTDAVTGSPLEFATVVLEGVEGSVHTAGTDRNGYYQIGGVGRVQGRRQGVGGTGVERGRASGSTGAGAEERGRATSGMRIGAAAMPGRDVRDGRQAPACVLRVDRHARTPENEGNRALARTPIIPYVATGYGTADNSMKLLESNS